VSRDPRLRLIERLTHAAELDLNDPATLEIYSRVLLFKDDRMRDDLSFSRNLSPLERRTVHLVAQKLGLYHYSMGEGDERYVVVTKNEMQQGHRVSGDRCSAVDVGLTHSLSRSLCARRPPPSAARTAATRTAPACLRPARAPRRAVRVCAARRVRRT